MSLHSRKTLYAKLNDRQYRHAFVASRLGHVVAAQVKALRQKRGMSQKELALELGTSQNAIYRLETKKDSRHSVSTLKKVADFFDVALVLRFAPMSELVDWTLHMTNKSLEVPSFQEDGAAGLHEGT